MFRIIIPTVILVAAIGLFVVYTNPTYRDTGELKIAHAAYDKALSNSIELQAVRDQLTEKYNALSETDRDRLKKLMPDNVDNIRMLIDIDAIASQYGMKPRDVKFDAKATSKAGQEEVVATTPDQVVVENKDYGTFELEFSVVGTYQNFLRFLNDMEKNLRLTDVQTISFQSADAGSTAIRYTIRIKTYWLKN